MAAPSQLVGQTLGHYRILEQIGAGGMGVVFRAHDEQLDRDVALKLLPAGAPKDAIARARLHKEALALARINSPNIATVHEFGTHGDLEYIVAEYISGITLETKIAGPRLTEPEVVHIALQLAQGLEAAHERGVVHRDLKPANLRFTPTGMLKILDFGIAKIAAPVSPVAETETIGQPFIAGTLPYMAPEQLRRETVDSRVDIWAAGAVLYEMATGRRPFPENGVAQLVEAILHQQPTPPRVLNPQLSPGLEAVIQKCIEKDPNRRYQTARDLAIGLGKLLPAAERTGEVEAAQPATATSGLRKHVILAMAAVCLITAAVTLAIHEWHVRWQNTQRVLAVLPFHALTGDASNQALGSGLTETLTARLSQIDPRNVLQLVSTQDIVDQGVKTADDARRQFGADLVLQGSLQQSGQLIRINCSLVDPRTHRQLGARTVTGDASDIFGLEDRTVDEALDILAVHISPTARRNQRTQSTSNAAAYEHYLRGRGYLQDYHKPENIESALAEFQLAVQSDPSYALAYAGLGQTYLRGFEQGNPGNDWVTKAAAECRHSLAITSDTVEGHICLGEVARVTGQYSTAVEHLQHALALDGNNEQALRDLAKSYEKQGDTVAAEATYQKAIAARPQYWAGYNWLGGFYFRHAKYVEATEKFRRVVELTPENFRGYSNLGGVYVTEGHYSEAIDALKRSVEIRPNLEALSNLGTAYFALRRFGDATEAYEQGLKLDNSDWLLWGNLGDALYWTPQRREEAARAYRKAITLCQLKLQVNPRDATVLAFLATYQAQIGEKDKAPRDVQHALALAPTDPEVRFRAALVYNQLGQTDLCLASLDKALQAGYPASALRDTPDFDHLRNNARFRLLLTRKPVDSNPSR